MPDNQTDSLISLKRLATNEDYYNIVFKKTERISSAVFYILSHISISETNRIHHNLLSQKAMSLHEAAIASLNLFPHEIKDGLYALQHALVALESSLMLSVGARVVSLDIVAPIADELDSVTRYIKNHYLNEAAGPSLSPRSATKPVSSLPRLRRQRPIIPKNDMSSEAVLVAKPEATIKDLADIITDVSTKTIQRDLNSLIQRGEVIRHGEKRWSKYSIA
jgi:hypothetical protein